VDTISSDKILNDAYRHESDADIRERILLVRRVKAEGKNVTDVAKNELPDLGLGPTNG
jgi:hypothetical protein